MKKNTSFNSIEFIQALCSELTNCTDMPEAKKIALQKGMQIVIAELSDAKEFDFREIANYLYDGLYIADGNGKTLYINKAYSRITGLREEEVVGVNVSDCEKMGLYKNAVTPQVIKQKTPINSLGKSLRTGISMLVTGVPILDDKGNVKKVIVIDREMTDLLEIQSALEDSQEKYRSVEAAKNKSKREVEHLRRQQINDNLIGQSPAMEQVSLSINQVAALDVTVLIMGETGTGKEVIANEIHKNSLRHDSAFIKVNCAAIPSNLLEAELFGFEKGAFTGASTARLGLFELADHGTLLLDEIGEMPLDLQAKLLRVIQHKELTRVGGKSPIKLDVRIICATNCALLDLVKQGKFREDLYYRINVFPIDLPPLRNRSDDVLLLTQHFLAIYNSKYSKNIAIKSAGMETLKEYAWPGNVRELQNIIERLVIISEQGKTIGCEQISTLLNIDPFSVVTADAETGLKGLVERVERAAIKKAIATHGSTRRAAKALRVDQSTIVKKSKKLGISLAE